MTHRVLTIISLLAALLLSAPVRASETLPNAQLSPEAKKRLEGYRSKSLYTLKNILTTMVDETARGKESFGARWSAKSGGMVAMLQSIGKAGMIKKNNPVLKKWYDAELVAWQNVQKIGFELLDLHYRMASNVAQIEKDVKHSKAYYTLFKEVVSKNNTDVGKLKNSLAGASKLVNNFKKFGSFVDKISSAGTLLSEHSQTVARLVRQFHKRQLEFIKDRGKLAEHRAALSRLKAKVIDPNQSGVFVGFEKDWEAKMAKTYASYIKAVDEWKKENRWHDGKDQLYSTYKSLISNWGGMPIKFLTIDVPAFLPKNAENISVHVTDLRGSINKGIKKYKGEKWAEIEKGLQSTNKERQELRIDFEARLDQIEEEARKKADEAEDYYEKIAKPLMNEYTRLANLLTRETDEGTMKTLARQIKKYEDDIEDAKGVLVTALHLHMVISVGQQQETAYKEFCAELKKIDERVKKLNKAKSELD
jgi:hypothetical protein